MHLTLSASHTLLQHLNCTETRTKFLGYIATERLFKVYTGSRIFEARFIRLS
ncbi:hypothetical protein SAMN05444128_3303 [Pontibacter indicus]|uniref:Uncharacterized protein n=1 Tax=Pontibacter indicus TaxID=1317125 RepID=A0A1R3XPM3_9BACT|nr:hypothetical protein SAMN05444128_3303 [Pontibacter indicus]